MASASPKEEGLATRPIRRRLTAGSSWPVGMHKTRPASCIPSAWLARKDATASASCAAHRPSCLCIIGVAPRSVSRMPCSPNAVASGGMEPRTAWMTPDRPNADANASGSRGGAAFVGLVEVGVFACASVYAGLSFSCLALLFFDDFIGDAAVTVGLARQFATFVSSPSERRGDTSGIGDIVAFEPQLRHSLCSRASCDHSCWESCNMCFPTRGLHACCTEVTRVALGSPPSCGP